MAFIQRTGQNTILRSEKLPAINIQIDPEFKYAGSTSFILHDIARVEQYHFVVSDTERRIGRHWLRRYRSDRHPVLKCCGRAG